MAINVVCTGCRSRFTVSEKFAGKKGPCPKCKAIITIPALADQVVIHAPEEAGPKDAKGRPVLRPIFREETTFSPLMAVVIGVAVLTVLLLTWILRPATGQQASLVVLSLGALLLAPPLAWSGYTFLRNDENQPFYGQELWTRVGLCGLAYAAIWGLTWGVNAYLFEGAGFEFSAVFFVIPIMVVAGAAAAQAILDFEFFTGILHYGLYLAVTVVLRLVHGLAAFPIDQ